MRNDLTDADVLTFVLAGCNAVEVATYGGTSEGTAQARMLRVTRHYAAPKRLARKTLRLGKRA